MPIDALSVSCVQLTRDLLAIAKFLLHFGVKMIQDPRWQISAILDFRGPVMGSLKSPCTTSYRSSILPVRRPLLYCVKIAPPLVIEFHISGHLTGNRFCIGGPSTGNSTYHSIWPFLSSALSFSVMKSP